MLLSKVPDSVLMELYELLDTTERYKEMGLIFLKMDLATIELAKHELASGRSPSKRLIELWGCDEHTVQDLFEIFVRMNFIEAMRIIKNYTTSRYSIFLKNDSPESNSNQSLLPSTSNSANREEQTELTEQSDEILPPNILHLQISVISPESLDQEESLQASPTLEQQFQESPQEQFSFVYEQQQQQQQECYSLPQEFRQSPKEEQEQFRQSPKEEQQSKESPQEQFSFFQGQQELYSFPQQQQFWQSPKEQEQQFRQSPKEQQQEFHQTLKELLESQQSPQQEFSFLNQEQHQQQQQQQIYSLPLTPPQQQQRIQPSPQEQQQFLESAPLSPLPQQQEQQEQEQQSSPSEANYFHWNPIVPSLHLPFELSPLPGLEISRPKQPRHPLDLISPTLPHPQHYQQQSDFVSMSPLEQQERLFSQEELELISPKNKRKLSVQPQEKSCETTDLQVEDEEKASSPNGDETPRKKQFFWAREKRDSPIKGRELFDRQSGSSPRIRRPGGKGRKPLPLKEQKQPVSPKLQNLQLLPESSSSTSPSPPLEELVSSHKESPPKQSNERKQFPKPEEECLQLSPSLNLQQYYQEKPSPSKQDELFSQKSESREIRRFSLQGKELQQQKLELSPRIQRIEEKEASSSPLEEQKEIISLILKESIKESPSVLQQSPKEENLTQFQEQEEKGRFLQPSPLEKEKQIDTATLEEHNPDSLQLPQQNPKEENYLSLPLEEHFTPPSPSEQIVLTDQTLEIITTPSKEQQNSRIEKDYKKVGKEDLKSTSPKVQRPEEASPSKKGELSMEKESLTSEERRLSLLKEVELYNSQSETSPQFQRHEEGKKNSSHPSPSKKDEFFSKKKFFRLEKRPLKEEELCDSQSETSPQSQRFEEKKDSAQPSLLEKEKQIEAPKDTTKPKETPSSSMQKEEQSLQEPLQSSPSQKQRREEPSPSKKDELSIEKQSPNSKERRPSPLKEGELYSSQFKTSPQFQRHEEKNNSSQPSPLEKGKQLSSPKDTTIPPPKEIQNLSIQKDSSISPQEHLQSSPSEKQRQKEPSPSKKDAPSIKKQSPKSEERRLSPLKKGELYYPQSEISPQFQRHKEKKDLLHPSPLEKEKQLAIPKDATVQAPKETQNSSIQKREKSQQEHLQSSPSQKQRREELSPSKKDAILIEKQSPKSEERRLSPLKEEELYYLQSETSPQFQRLEEKQDSAQPLPLEKEKQLAIPKDATVQAPKETQNLSIQKKEKSPQEHLQSSPSQKRRQEETSPSKKDAPSIEKQPPKSEEGRLSPLNKEELYYPKSETSPQFQSHEEKKNSPKSSPFEKKQIAAPKDPTIPPPKEKQRREEPSPSKNPPSPSSSIEKQSSKTEEKRLSPLKEGELYYPKSETSPQFQRHEEKKDSQHPSTLEKEKQFTTPKEHKSQPQPQQKHFTPPSPSQKLKLVFTEEELKKITTPPKEQQSPRDENYSPLPQQKHITPPSPIKQQKLVFSPKELKLITPPKEPEIEKKLLPSPQQPEQSEKVLPLQTSPLEAQKPRVSSTKSLKNQSPPIQQQGSKEQRSSPQHLTPPSPLEKLTEERQNLAQILFPPEPEDLLSPLAEKQFLNKKEQWPSPLSPSKQKQNVSPSHEQSSSVKEFCYQRLPKVQEAEEEEKEELNQPSPTKNQKDIAAPSDSAQEDQTSSLKEGKLYYQIPKFAQISQSKHSQIQEKDEEKKCLQLSSPFEEQKKSPSDSRPNKLLSSLSEDVKFYPRSEQTYFVQSNQPSPKIQKEEVKEKLSATQQQPKLLSPLKQEQTLSKEKSSPLPQEKSLSPLSPSKQFWEEKLSPPKERFSSVKKEELHYQRPETLQLLRSRLPKLQEEDEDEKEGLLSSPIGEQKQIAPPSDSASKNQSSSLNKEVISYQKADLLGSPHTPSPQAQKQEEEKKYLSPTQQELNPLSVLEKEDIPAKPKHSPQDKRLSSPSPTQIHLNPVSPLHQQHISAKDLVSPEEKSLSVLSPLEKEQTLAKQKPSPQDKQPSPSRQFSPKKEQNFSPLDEECFSLEEKGFDYQLPEITELYHPKLPKIPEEDEEKDCHQTSPLKEQTQTASTSDSEVTYFGKSPQVQKQDRKDLRSPTKLVSSPKQPDLNIPRAEPVFHILPSKPFSPSKERDVSPSKEQFFLLRDRELYYERSAQTQLLPESLLQFRRPITPAPLQFLPITPNPPLQPKHFSPSLFFQSLEPPSKPKLPLLPNELLEPERPSPIQAKRRLSPKMASASKPEFPLLPKQSLEPKLPSPLEPKLPLLPQQPFEPKLPSPTQPKLSHLPKQHFGPTLPLPEEQPQDQKDKGKKADQAPKADKSPKSLAKEEPDCASIGTQHRRAAQSSIPQVPYNDLQKGTYNWNSKLILGRGGFGTVFKGEWKCTKVAIKRIEKKRIDKSEMISEDQFKEEIRQSITELRCLTSIRHDNIISLYGFSTDGPHSCLIYQYMGGGSLDNRLHRSNQKSTKLINWRTRMNIAIGSARGIQFLHTVGEKPLIHGDIKPGNILLDANDNPRIGDFGLARDGPSNEYTHLVISRVQGTLPYLPTEFLRSRKLSIGVDVYSFGVVLFQIATSLRSYDKNRNLEPYLREFIRNFTEDIMTLKYRHHSEKNDDVDKETSDRYFQALIELGKWCVRERAKERPQMVKVLMELEKVCRGKELDLGTGGQSSTKL